MADRREIRRMKKEFEKLIKTVGVDNLSDPGVVEKAMALERMLYDSQSEYRAVLAENGYAM